MVALNAVQERNFRAALAVAGSDAGRDRLAFAIWSESGGYIYANDGRNTSNSPGVTDAVKAILRRSLDLPHDKVGSNGRSTGMLQQLSADVGGGWGDMAGTMDPATSARRFLNALRVTDNRVYSGTLVTPTGTRKVNVQLSSPIAADVLRVQQPLADEAESPNYGAGAVAIARELSAQFAPTTQGDWFMANNWDEAKAEVEAMLKPLKGIDENAGEARRINGVLAGALPGENGEKSVETQVFRHQMQMEGDWPFENFLLELNKKVDRTLNALGRIETKLNEKGV